jgi:hypothetical protein
MKTRKNRAALRHNSELQKFTKMRVIKRKKDQCCTFTTIEPRLGMYLNIIQMADRKKKLLCMHLCEKVTLVGLEHFVISIVRNNRK